MQSVSLGLRGGERGQRGGRLHKVVEKVNVRKKSFRQRKKAKRGRRRQPIPTLPGARTKR